MIPKVKLTEQGPETSQLVLGLKALAERGYSVKRLEDWMNNCLDLGYTTVELADVYGGYRCETVFGRLLAKKPALRSNIQIIGKCGMKLVHRKRPQNKVSHVDTSTMHIVTAVEHSLNELNTEYLDLLLLHRPDPLLDCGEVAEAFTQLKQAGKVRSFGVCKFNARQIEALQAQLVEPLVINQVEFSLGHIDPLFDGLADIARKNGTSILAGVPLAQGHLTTPDSDHFLEIAEVLNQVQRQCGAKSVEAVAIAWLLRLPFTVVPVIRSAKLNRLKAAVEGTEITLTREQWYSLLQAALGADNKTF